MSPAQSGSRLPSRAGRNHDQAHHPPGCTCDKWNKHLRDIQELTVTSPSAAIRALHATLDPATRDPDLMPSLRCELYIMLSDYPNERPAHCLAEAAIAMKEWQADCDLLPAKARFPVQKHIIQMKRRMKQAQDVVDSRARFEMLAKSDGETPLAGAGFVEEIDSSDDEADEGFAAPKAIEPTRSDNIRDETQSEIPPEAMPEIFADVTRMVYEQMMQGGGGGFFDTPVELGTTRSGNPLDSIGRGVGEGNRRERRARAKAEKKMAKLKR